MISKEYFANIAKTPILAITIFAISTVAIILDAPLIIPTFAASLYTLIILQHGHTAKVVIISHLIAFVLAATAPFLFQALTFITTVILAPTIFGLIVFLASLIFTVTKLDHAPAIASTIVFFEAEKQGFLIFGLMPLNVTIAFGVGLLIVGLTAKYYTKFFNKD